jgi:hypothetical protein
MAMWIIPSGDVGMLILLVVRGGRAVPVES